MTIPIMYLKGSPSKDFYPFFSLGTGGFSLLMDRRYLTTQCIFDDINVLPNLTAVPPDWFLFPSIAITSQIDCIFLYFPLFFINLARTLIPTGHCSFCVLSLDLI